MPNPAVISSNEPPSLSIVMLSGSGAVKMDTMMCLLMSCQVLAKHWVKYDFISVQGVTGVDNARNIAAEIFMQGNHSHMLMIDDDMGWSADLPLRMLKEGVDILGVPYLRKNIKNPRWTVNHPAPDADVMQGRPYLLKVDSVATGMMMVKRSVLEKLRPSVDKAILSQESPPIPLYFRHTIDDRGVMKSEDFSFCELARKAGVDIWAWVDEEIAHIGNYAYTGRYVDKLGDAAKDMVYAGPRIPLRVMLE